MATKKFSPAQIAAQKLFAERARAGTLGKAVKRNPAPNLEVISIYKTPSGKVAMKITYDISSDRFSYVGEYGAGSGASYSQMKKDVLMMLKYHPRVTLGSGEDFTTLGDPIGGRKTNPAPENDFVKKIVANIKRRMKSFGDPYEKAKSLSLLGFNYDDKMSALIDEQFSKRATMPKYNAAAVNKAIASSRSKISASEGKTIHRLLKGRHGNPAAAMMTAAQVQRVKQALKESETALSRATRYSPENQDKGLIDFYQKHIAKLRKSMETGKFPSDERFGTSRQTNPAAAMMTGYQVICMHPKKHVVGVFKTMAEAKQIATALANAKGVAYGVKAVKVHKAHFAA